MLVIWRERSSKRNASPAIAFISPSVIVLTDSFEEKLGDGITKISHKLDGKFHELKEEIACDVK